MARKPRSTDTVRSLLKKQRIASLDQLKKRLGTSSTMTVCRKLKELGYRSSYSHRGKYYTLLEVAEFDERGLWTWHDVWFSERGNLLETAKHFIDQADAGLTANELQLLLHVEVKQSLLHLVRQKQIGRVKIGNVYVYVARNKGKKKSQSLLRQDQESVWDIGVTPTSESVSQEQKASMILLFSLLDEKQRRLFAGLESQKLGHGGDQKIADLFGLNVHTVARGRRELFAGEVERGRVRQVGGGRKAVEKKRRKSSGRSQN